MSTTCPVCGLAELEPFLDLDEVPLLTTEFHPDRASALDAPRGDLHLAVCRACALVWNTAFDPALIDYTADYENSQHFSPAFRDFVGDLAVRLTKAHDLPGRTVVEIGSGKGEFLALLAETAGCEAIGFDPSFAGEVAEGRVRVERRYYDRDAASRIDAALVVARHVVEHLDDPVSFLTDVRRAGGPETAVYYEVPNAAFVLSDGGMWDLIYQHVGYFSQPSLEHAVRAAGYEVTDVREAFFGQFLSIEAHPAAARADPPDAQRVTELVGQAERFGDRFREQLDARQRRLAAADHGPVLLWGAGAKGVAFLNLLGDPGLVARVVDRNPRKVGRFVPGTGHRVEAPRDVAGIGEAHVLLTNPAYEAEIRDELERLGISAIVEKV